MIPRQEIAKTERQAQYLLAHGHPRQHLVDEAGSALGHAPAAAARAEAPALAGERHEPLKRAIVAPEAREAVRQHTASQEVVFSSQRTLGQVHSRGVASRREGGRMRQGNPS